MNAVDSAGTQEIKKILLQHGENKKSYKYYSIRILATPYHKCSLLHHKLTICNVVISYGASTID